MGEGQRQRKGGENGDLSEACVRRHTMLVSVPLLFLHAKKFLSLPQRGRKTEKAAAGPQRERGRERKRERRGVKEIIEASAGTR